MKEETKKLIKQYQDLGGKIHTATVPRAFVSVCSTPLDDEKALEQAKSLLVNTDFDEDEFIKQIKKRIEGIEYYHERINGTPFWNELRKEGY